MILKGPLGAFNLAAAFSDPNCLLSREIGVRRCILQRRTKGLLGLLSQPELHWQTYQGDFKTKFLNQALKYDISGVFRDPFILNAFSSG
jgi:hypothetical protein